MLVIEDDRIGKGSFYDIILIVKWEVILNQIKVEVA